MKRRAAWLGLALMAAVIGIFLAGCATAPYGSPAGSPAQSQDDLLSAAGFSLREAKTPRASAI